MVLCSFCESEIKTGSGIIYAKRDGTLYYFCSSKCRKNQLNLGREGRRQKWTKAYARFKGKEKRVEEKKK